MRLTWNVTNLLLRTVAYFGVVAGLRLVATYLPPVGFVAAYDFNALTWIAPLAAASLSLLALRAPIRSGTLTATKLIVRFALIGLCVGFLCSALFWMSYFAGWAGRMDSRIIEYGFAGAARTAKYVIPASLVVSLILAGLTAAMLLRRAGPSSPPPAST